ncbi:MAG: hypothetical protein AB7P03_05765 [Kofleriaceae bacterium]
MALVTSFRATGRCPSCGTDGDIWIQTHFGSDGATYQVGDDVSADINDPELRSGSFLVRKQRAASRFTC